LFFPNRFSDQKVKMVLFALTAQERAGLGSANIGEREKPLLKLNIILRVKKNALLSIIFILLNIGIDECHNNIPH